MDSILDPDEYCLRLSSLSLRAFEIFNSLFILSAVAQFMSDLTATDIAVPGQIVAVEAIACTAAAYGFFILLPTCCGGALFFKCISVSDFIFAGLFIFCSVISSEDTTVTCIAFGKKYFGANISAPVYYDCHLTRTAFAFSIINT